MSQIKLLLRLYVNPSKTFSRILDEGQLVFAAFAALAVVLALQIPREAVYRAAETKERMSTAKQRIDKAIERATRSVTSGQKQLSQAMDEEWDDVSDAMELPSQPPLRTAVDRLTGANPTQYLSPLIAMAVCFVPAVILMVTLLDNLGGFNAILFRDYMALLVCVLLAWTAPYTLMTAIKTAAGRLHLPIHDYPALWWAAQAWFLLLTTLAVRTLFGTRLWHAAGATVCGWIAAAGGICIYGACGNVSTYVASPFLLYYLYLGVGPQISGFGASLSSRQRFKQRLENATLNPRDADAHYQLGLIYGQRRQYDEAVKCFARAIEIDPREADSFYQLGHIEREQGRYAEALEHCRTAARLDDKHSSSEVWREIGIASYLAGDRETARQALEKYRERRPYDPEGACWYGRTMASLGQTEAARASFQEAVDAVRTMPPARKRQVRSWEAEARRDLKKLPASAALVR